MLLSHALLGEEAEMLFPQRLTLHSIDKPCVKLSRGLQNFSRSPAHHSGQAVPRPPVHQCSSSLQILLQKDSLASRCMGLRPTLFQHKPHHSLLASLVDCPHSPQLEQILNLLTSPKAHPTQCDGVTYQH